MPLGVNHSMKKKTSKTKRAARSSLQRLVSTEELKRRGESGIGAGGGVGGVHHIISLGAGVQSSTMALMAACGEITPMPTSAVFADTQAEPESVYRWLDWLEKKLPFPVFRVSKGSLTHTSLTVRNRKDGTGKWVKSLIPAFIQNPDGSRGIMGRACTFDYKVMQLESASKIIGGIKRNQKTIGVIQWIGISLDEAHRMKPARKPWVEHRWPLIDLRMKRHDCLRWMEAKGYPKPPRSACVYCPFHSDAEWRRLKYEEPVEFMRAVQFERALQEAKAKTDNQRGKPFLHNSLKPLGEVDFSTDVERGQGELFGNDCTGLCGV
jgi:hypothetical protein